MLFNTVDFIVFFAFVVSLIVVIRNRNFNYILLIAASYFFFYFSNNFLITLLIFSTILDYFVGKHIWLTDDKKKKKKLLLLSIIGNLGLLGFFKFLILIILKSTWIILNFTNTISWNYFTSWNFILYFSNFELYYRYLSWKFNSFKIT